MDMRNGTELQNLPTQMLGLLVLGNWQLRLGSHFSAEDLVSQFPPSAINALHDETPVVSQVQHHMDLSQSLSLLQLGATTKNKWNSIFETLKSSDFQATYVIDLHSSICMYICVYVFIWANKCVCIQIIDRQIVRLLLTSLTSTDPGKVGNHAMLLLTNKTWSAP